MADNTTIRVAVLESSYVSLVDHGVPLSVCLQMQQLGLLLQQAQWTARHSTGGFSISFFWPTLEQSPPEKKAAKPKKARKKKGKKESTSKPACHQSTKIHQKTPENAKIAYVEQKCSKTPLIAHPGHLEPEPYVTPSKSLSSSLPCTTPNLSECLEVRYECRNSTPGVSYQTVDGKDEWTPVVKRKTKIKRTRATTSESSESSDNGSEVDVSCSRLVKFEERNGIPGLMIHRRGPGIWTAIKAAKQESDPVSSRTRSKSRK